MALIDNPATGLTELQQQAARLLASGVSEQAAAKEVGKHPKTITRWLKLSAFQAYLAEWRAKGEAKAEAKQDDMAEIQANIATKERELYVTLLTRMEQVAESGKDRDAIAALRELREAVHAKDKSGGGMHELLAGVIAGKFGDKMIPIPGEEQPVGFEIVPRPGQELKH